MFDFPASRPVANRKRKLDETDIFAGPEVESELEALKTASQQEDSRGPPEIKRLIKRHVGNADDVGRLNGAQKKAWKGRLQREVRIVVDGQDGLPKLSQKLKTDYNVQFVIEMKRLKYQALATAINILKTVPLKIYSLTLHGCDLTSWPGISAFMAACVNMHTLIISGGSTLVPSVSLVEAVKHCLHTLDLHDCDMINVTHLGQCKKLHTLNLSGNFSLTDVAGLGQCASLHTLNLSTCTELKKVADLGQCASLHTLDLSHCRTLRNVAALGQCTSLHTLDLSRCKKLRNVDALGQSASLHTLDLSWCSALESVAGLEQCASLHTLDLLMCYELISVAGLGQCASLHTLDLSWCFGLKSVAGLEQCTSLHTLNLHECKVTDVTALGQCPGLHTLDLSECTKLANVDGLRQCASLRSLNLSNCTGLPYGTGQVLKAHMAGPCMVVTAQYRPRAF